jgi:DNA repair exonuclease SbcCD ATPase subunit
MPRLVYEWETTVPNLKEEIERLRAENERLRATLDRHKAATEIVEQECAEVIDQNRMLIDRIKGAPAQPGPAHVCEECTRLRAENERLQNIVSGKSELTALAEARDRIAELELVAENERLWTEDLRTQNERIIINWKKDRDEKDRLRAENEQFVAIRLNLEKERNELRAEKANLQKSMGRQIEAEFSARAEVKRLQAERDDWEKCTGALKKLKDANEQALRAEIERLRAALSMIAGCAAYNPQLNGVSDLASAALVSCKEIADT